MLISHVFVFLSGPCDAPGARDCGKFGECNDDKCAKEKTCVCIHGYTGKHCEIGKIHPDYIVYVALELICTLIKAVGTDL